MIDTKLNIYQRINEVRKAIGYAQKDRSVSTGGGSYKAVSHDAVTGMVRSSLIENGVIIVSSVMESVFHQKEPDSKQRLYEATYQIDFVNMDNPEDRIITKQNAHALDNGDKAPGKAMSYATKYAILKLFNIETGEDEESRYQVEDFDFSSALTKAEAAENSELALSIIVDAKKRAIDSKNKVALDAIKAVSKKLSVKFAPEA